jgi:hypothetical protein
MKLGAVGGRAQNETKHHRRRCAVKLSAYGEDSKFCRAKLSHIKRHMRRLLKLLGAFGDGAE